ncbi:hypothetical protein D3C81_2208060 [compost metagenome]
MKAGIPLSGIIGNDGLMGYDGILKIGRLYSDAMENPNWLRKVAAHTPSPYRREWFEASPFKYYQG